ncbi:spore coat protein [Paenibacillus lutrae]|uniref:Coat F domain protein n=1 Tax=Paenibacillus lutrae TaxID=2078573 RepID=A0A7X3FF28_9BACL|nr:spore coat protein [Paenibacillus lutrae]MVO98482.1 coat F domain protein [Paenibacillus lutrae]
MPFGAHETVEVHEILTEKMNMIQHFSLYAGMSSHPQVGALVQQHLYSAIQHYNELVAYTHDYSAAGQPHAYGQPPAVPVQDIVYGLRHPAQQSPRTDGTLGDEQILTAVLCCHKNSSRNQMTAALECADPNVRRMLLTFSVAAADHAYEVFLLLNAQGQYQVPTMHDHTAKTYLHTFQAVNEQPGNTYAPAGSDSHYAAGTGFAASSGSGYGSQGQSYRPNSAGLSSAHQTGPAYDNGGHTHSYANSGPYTQTPAYRVPEQPAPSSPYNASHRDGGHNQEDSLRNGTSPYPQSDYRGSYSSPTGSVSNHEQENRGNTHRAFPDSNAHLYASDSYGPRGQMNAERVRNTEEHGKPEEHGNTDVYKSH